MDVSKETSMIWSIANKLRGTYQSDKYKEVIIPMTIIRRFSENAEAGDHYTGRDIIKLMVNILLSEGCDDIFDDGKIKATNFVQEKTKEYKVSDLTAQPVVKLPTADTVSLAPAKEERLSQIIAEINSRTGKNYDNNIDDALIEGLDQNQDFFTLLLDNEELKKEVLGIFADEIYQHLRQE
ncbi:type I restriction-modification system subunit M N-terminal domain-containing protein [uncultured Megasphaera sp.]|uniref:type I restriction-modification system subunit M N-terminal domain-containing protein n=1 Tax=uncultured Megasphaera sp. TaxID=165188 RepID=UPI0028691623|nr:type I restriction-modification system subunit M N-terminal domain-containing protein [uncultured Megasphaera sp.]